MAYDADTIKRARKLAGLTQEELGQRVGSPRSVNRWEQEGITDRSPHVEKVERVLHLTDPAVLRRIHDMDSADLDEEVVGDDPRDLTDGDLLARIGVLTAELHRRFWARAHVAPRLQGQPVPYPHHLDDGSVAPDRAGHDR